LKNKGNENKRQTLWKLRQKSQRRKNYPGMVAYIMNKEIPSLFRQDKSVTKSLTGE